MGGTSWSVGSYRAATASKIASGTTFGYTSHARATGSIRAHELLDPTKKNAAGLNIREARDSAAHPNATPVAVFSDLTGSMANSPRVVQKKLPELFGLLTRKGYAEDAAIMIGGYGDAEVDRVPLQVSQFESGNEIDLAVDQLFLEGGGGGNFHEHATLLWYYMAYHTATDAWDKRNKKGYLFFVADETAGNLTADQIKRYVGDGEPLGKLDVKSLAEAVKEKWEVYVLLIDNLSAKQQQSQKFYTDLFGADHLLILENDEAVVETIALTVGLREGTLDVDDMDDDMKAVGSSAVAIRSATKAVAGLAKLGGTGAVAKTSGGLGHGGGRGAARL